MSNYRPIVKIDISKGLSPIDFRDAPNGIYLIAWWRHFPLVHKHIEPNTQLLDPADIAALILPNVQAVVDAYLTKWGFAADKMLSFKDLPLAFTDTATQLKTILNQLDYIQPETLENEHKNLPSVSIIVPTINRPGTLFQCLYSLQRLKQKPTEIIVVDNDPSTKVSAKVVNHFSEVTYLPQPKIGASAARNLGVQHCKGDIVVFVDDDEHVDPFWLSNLIEGFNNPKVGCTTGLVLPGAIETKAQDFFETRFSFVRGYQPITFDQAFFNRGKITGVPVWHIGGSGNMAVRRELFLKLGGFDERLGGGHAGCSEDTEFFYRVLASGWQIDYQPLAICYHYHRTDAKSLQNQIFSYMRGHVTALLVQFLKHKHVSNLIRLLLVLPIFYLKYFVRGLLKSLDFPLWVWQLEVFGCLSGLVYFWQNRKFWMSRQGALASEFSAQAHPSVQLSGWD
ncbi:MAG: glycosyltransferase family 2 protein [Anaerolineae bacterium]